MIDEGELLERARQARLAAYAPYSKFQVGAALFTASGQIFTGCNVENASYGLTICAERVAVGTAISEGEREFELLAVCAPGGAAPCGACRQVLHEFSPSLMILMADPEQAETQKRHLAELLPHTFESSSLDI